MAGCATTCSPPTGGSAACWRCRERQNEPGGADRSSACPRRTSAAARILGQGDRRRVARGALSGELPARCAWPRPVTGAARNAR